MVKNRKMKTYKYLIFKWLLFSLIIICRANGFSQETKINDKVASANLQIKSIDVGSSNTVTSVNVSNFNIPNRIITLSDDSRAYIEYSFKHSKITKPFLFVEGLNFEPDPNVDDACKENQYRYGTIGWDVFRSGKDLCSDYPLKIDSLPLLLEAIKADGFDIIMLDFRDGAGDIVHNADIVIELINLVNAELKANESEYPIVLAGASMGGVVTRYALSKMEQTNQDHNTRFWIALDAPLRGANIPIGDQFLIDFFSQFPSITEMKPEIIYAKRKLCKKAPRQLMYRHFLGDNISENYKLNDFSAIQTSPYYTFPQKTYSISIVNGAKNAIGQPYNSGAKMIDIDHTEHGKAIDHEQGEIFASPNGSGKVFWGKVYIIAEKTKELLPILEESTKSVKDFKPYDSAPGGTRSTNNEMGQGQDIYPKHCFVPTISALSLSTDDLYYNISTSPIMDNYPYIRKENKGLCPFDYVFLQDINEAHLQVTFNNIEAIINVIAGDDLKLQNTTLKGIYEARNSVTAGSNIFTEEASPDQGVVVVKYGTSTKLRSEKSVTLKPGFKVESGASFISYISPYDNAKVRYTKAAPSATLKTLKTPSSAVGNFTSIDSLKNIKSTEFRISPNPTDGNCSITFNNDESFKYIEVYNLTGQKVFNQETSESFINMNLTSLPKGIYILSIKSNNKVTLQKIILE
jgi:hypothetical protein